MTHTQNQPIASGDEVLRWFTAGTTDGLPTPTSYRIHTQWQSIDVTFDHRADLDAWLPRLGFDTAPEVAWRGQPYPLDVAPHQYREWITTVTAPWQGWQLNLSAIDPITASQRDNWVTSGQAADRAAWSTGSTRQAA